MANLTETNLKTVTERKIICDGSIEIEVENAEITFVEKVKECKKIILCNNPVAKPVSDIANYLNYQLISSSKNF